MTQWLVLHTKSRMEYLVNEFLISKGFETFLPAIPTKVSTRLKVLFPGYLFLKESTKFASSPKIVSRAPGLVDIVGFGATWARVPDQVISQIKNNLEDIVIDDTLQQNSYAFKKGDVVHITDPAFGDLAGIFNQYINTSSRVEILLQCLGKYQKITVDQSLVELTSNQSNRPNRPVRKNRRTRGRKRYIKYTSDL